MGGTCEADANEVDESRLGPFKLAVTLFKVLNVLLILRLMLSKLAIDVMGLLLGEFLFLLLVTRGGLTVSLSEVIKPRALSAAFA